MAKSVTHWLEGSPENKKLIKSSLYAYEDNHHKIVEATFQADGAFDSLWLYVYDSKGNWIKRTQYSASKPRTLEQAANSYDNKGHLMKRTILEHGKTKSTERFQNGRVVEWYQYSLDGSLESLESRTVNHYDERGNEVESLTYDKNNHLKTHIVYAYEYDSRGNWIKANSQVVVKDGKLSKDASVITRVLTYYEK